jgi:UDP-2,4-diacetamido-2,4,6-trideoxy-beta-L-altropyranose hydrolase
MPPGILIRADASTAIGSGHVMRCLTLAEALRKKGASVEFACRELEGNLCVLLEERGFKVYRLPTGVISEQLLGQPFHPDRDALEILNTVAVRPDWLVVDHYDIDLDWERQMHKFSPRILVIDDLANREHDADLLLDCSVVAEKADYEKLVPPSCELLLGGKYALLRDKFSASRLVPRRGLADRKKMHFALGGGSANRLIPGVLKWLLEGVENLSFHVLAGSHATADALEEFPEYLKARFSYEQSPSDVVSGMLNCDVALGAPGGMTWERFCLGLPFAAFSTHPNQDPVLGKLDEKGWLLNLGPIELRNENALERIRRWLDDDRLLLESRMRIQNAIDGLGAQRVAEQLFSRLKK